MSSTGARESDTPNKRAVKGIIENEKNFVQSLRVFSNVSTIGGAGGGGGSSPNAPQDPAGNYFDKNGDIIRGPVGNN